MLTTTLLALLTATPAPIPPAEAVVTEVVDGDTIDVVVNGVTERVRLIGIDAPEFGQCGYEEATDLLDLLVGDAPVTLSGGDAVDRYGRLLRFVSVGQPVGEVYGADTYDAGVALTANGYAIARYDSSDGYDAHAAEVLYHDTDVDSPDPVLNACDPGQELPARFVPADYQAPVTAPATTQPAPTPDPAQPAPAPAESNPAPAQPAPAVTAPVAPAAPHRPSHPPPRRPRRSSSPRPPTATTIRTTTADHATPTGPARLAAAGRVRDGPLIGAYYYDIDPSLASDDEVNRFVVAIGGRVSATKSEPDPKSRG